MKAKTDQDIMKVKDRIENGNMIGIGIEIEIEIVYEKN